MLPAVPEAVKLEVPLLLKVVQSAEDKEPVAEPEAMGRLKVMVPVEVAMLNSVPVIPVLKVKLGPKTPRMVVVAPPPVAVEAMEMVPAEEVEMVMLEPAERLPTCQAEPFAIRS